AATLVAATLVAATLVAATLVAATLVAATLVAATLVATTLVAATLVATTLVATTLVAATDRVLAGRAARVSSTDGVRLSRARLDLDARGAGVDADLQCLRGTGRSQRGTRGDHRTRGYPRDANTRLLRHVLLPPVAESRHGAAVRGPWALGDISLGEATSAVVISPAPRFAPVPDIRMLL
ncbi:hypothetical protein, partial [Streptomyces sp. NPDC059171]|uniref:hypothetical protein n=1 Tax=Streptomyces sp. NPDC059171 TaxID=3346755 RepID=UPI0036BDD7D4